MPLSKLYLEYIENVMKLNNGTSNNKLDLFDELNINFENKYEKFQKEINKNFGKDEVIQYQLNQISRLVFSVVEKLQSIFLTIFFSKSQSKTSTLEISKKTKK